MFNFLENIEYFFSHTKIFNNTHIHYILESWSSAHLSGPSRLRGRAAFVRRTRRSILPEHSSVSIVNSGHHSLRSLPRLDAWCQLVVAMGAQLRAERCLCPRYRQLWATSVEEFCDRWRAVARGTVARWFLRSVVRSLSSVRARLRVSRSGMRLI